MHNSMLSQMVGKPCTQRFSEFKPCVAQWYRVFISIASLTVGLSHQIYDFCRTQYLELYKSHQMSYLSLKSFCVPLIYLLFLLVLLSFSLIINLVALAQQEVMQSLVKGKR